MRRGALPLDPGQGRALTIRLRCAARCGACRRCSTGGRVRDDAGLLVGPPANRNPPPLAGGVRGGGDPRRKAPPTSPLSPLFRPLAPQGRTEGNLRRQPLDERHALVEVQAHLVAEPIAERQITRSSDAMPWRKPPAWIIGCDCGWKSVTRSICVEASADAAEASEG